MTHFLGSAVPLSWYESLFFVAGVTNHTDAGGRVVRITLTMTYYIRMKF